MTNFAQSKAGPDHNVLDSSVLTCSHLFVHILHCHSLAPQLLRNLFGRAHHRTQADGWASVR
eukprot:10650749-Karenia_brevis.AAC.1